MTREKASDTTIMNKSINLKLLPKYALCLIKSIEIAVKIADGNLPGELFPEKTNEITTVIYQKDAAMMLEMLYGNV